MRARVLIGLAACLINAGCVSVWDPPEGPPPQRPLPSVRDARYGDFELSFVESFNGEPRAPEDHEETERQEHQTFTSLIHEYIAETGLVGYLGQEGLEDALLSLELHRDVSASVLHGIASGLTLGLFPYWVEVRYEVRLEDRLGARVLATSRHSDSWCLVIQPFLIFAYPFDEPTDTLALVEPLVQEALRVAVEEWSRDPRDAR